MCDYSLAYFPNRLAVKGEQLVVYRFPCGTLGVSVLPAYLVAAAVSERRASGLRSPGSPTADRGYRAASAA